MPSLPLDRMSSADRSLLAHSMPRIVTLADEQGFAFPGQGSGEVSGLGWEARQAVCTALPDHLLMNYRRAPGTHHEASFSVVILRTGSGRLHLVPVERKGYSLYTPSRRNRLTMVVFNDLLREDAHAVRADWLGLALCYAALAGDQVQAVTTLMPSGGDPSPNYMPASLSVSWKAPPSITFVGLPPSGGSPLQWTLLFERSGRLHKVQMKKAYQLSAVPAKGQIVDLK